MTVQSEIRTQLIAEVSDVSSRVYPVKLPQNATFPAIRYVRLSAIRDYTLTKSDGLPAARFQIDIFAKGFDECRTVAEKARKALDGFSGDTIQFITVDNETEDFDDDLELYRVFFDFVVQYCETFN